MRVGIAGCGPAAEAVRAGLEDVDATSVECEPSEAGEVDLAVVVGRAGEDRFREANRAVRDGESALVSVELGGVGGHPVDGVEAAISGFGPDTGCFECLRRRVAANHPEPGSDGEETDAATARFAGAVAAREVAGLVAGERSLLGHVVEVPHVRRRLLPVPGCACAGDRAGHLRRGDAERPLESTLAAAEQAVDDRVGVVHEVGEAESFPAPYYLASLADTGGFSDATAPGHAAGVAADWNPAYVKALGEALERYSAAVYRTREFETGPPGAVARAVPPSAFVTSPAFGSPDPRREIRWVEGERLTPEGTTPVNLPAEFVVFPPPETRHRPSITTGLGLGNSGTGALLSGLYEVVERDAAMLAWYSTFEPLGLAVEDEGYRTLERRLRAEDLEATALLLTQDVDVPVVAVCVTREGDWPRFAAGMSADLDPAAAARGALEEAVQNFLELRGMGPEQARQEGAIADYAEFPPAAREFVSPETTVPVASVGPESVPSGRAELDSLLDRLGGAGLDAYATRLTPRDVETLGFEAVRVLVPSAQPLFTGEPYFGERAREVPTALGFEARLDREHHPFP